MDPNGLLCLVTHKPKPDTHPKKEVEESQQQKNLCVYICMSAPRYRPPFHEHAAIFPPFLFSRTMACDLCGTPILFLLDVVWNRAKRQSKKRKNLVLLYLHDVELDTIDFFPPTMCVCVCAVTEKWLSSSILC